MHDAYAEAQGVQVFPMNPAAYSGPQAKVMGHVDKAKMRQDRCAAKKGERAVRTQGFMDMSVRMPVAAAQAPCLFQLRSSESAAKQLRSHPQGRLQCGLDVVSRH